MKSDSSIHLPALRAPVLIVDDRPENLEALGIILSDLGDPIVRASSGQRALEILLEADFAVILLDVRMPEMDGLETARYIRQGKRSKHTPIIFVTAGEDDVAGAMRGYSAGAVDYIRKPLEPEILRSKVRVFVELHHKSRDVALKAEALAKANADLRSAYQHLEVFTYSVAHELRAPLRAMAGFSQILREEYASKLEPAAQDYAMRIAHGAQRMDLLIRDLLTYCNVARSPLESAAIDPNEVIREALVALGPALAARSAEVSAEVGFPEVIGSRTLLGLAMSSFLSNALKFVPPEVRPKIRIGHELRGGRTRLWVEDNGVGIHSDHQERIFGVFERLTVSAGASGTGIGLAIAKVAAERMAGSVGVDSIPGQGSRFWIELETTSSAPTKKSIEVQPGTAP